MSEVAPTTTRMQAYAQRAFERVVARKGAEKFDEYARFAKSFPALIHSCGLCQAVAFAEAKQHKWFLEDVVHVLHDASIISAAKLAEEARTAMVVQYLLWSRRTLLAAMWLKRYVEALSDD